MPAGGSDEFICRLSEDGECGGVHELLKSVSDKVPRLLTRFQSPITRFPVRLPPDNNVVYLSKCGLNLNVELKLKARGHQCQEHCWSRGLLHQG